MQDEEAYWLGFLCADGYVLAESKRGGNKRIGFELQFRDYMHIKKIFTVFWCSNTYLDRKYEEYKKCNAFVSIFEVMPS